MSADPSKPEPDYAHTHDPQAQRTRYELWAIVLIVIVVLAGAFIWRATTGQKPGPQKGWSPTENVSGAGVVTPAAGAGVNPHGAGTPPRPVAP